MATGDGLTQRVVLRVFPFVLRIVVKHSPGDGAIREDKLQSKFQVEARNAEYETRFIIHKGSTRSNQNVQRTRVSVPAGSVATA
jgi:hypothetical protein